MITGDSFGIVQGYALMDIGSGEIVRFEDLAGGGSVGPAGPKGDKGDKGDTGATGAAGAAGLGIKSIAANNAGGTVTLTFTMTDNTTKTASFTL